MYRNDNEELLNKVQRGNNDNMLGLNNFPGLVINSFTNNISF